MKQKNDCPFWRGPCRTHECRLYIQVQGKHPQSEETINRWGCSFEFLPLLLIENSQMQNQTGAAVEGLRNLVAKGMNGAPSPSPLPLLISYPQLGDDL